MTVHRLEELLAAASSDLEPEAYAELRRLCPAHASRFMPHDPAAGPVGGTLPSLKARAENARRNGKRVYGLDALIGKLETLAGEDVIVGYGVEGERSAGTIYAAADPAMRVLGFTMVDV